MLDETTLTRLEAALARRRAALEQEIAPSSRRREEILVEGDDAIATDPAGLPEIVAPD
ncbi:MAG: hypothetical protein U1F45_16445 [Burkholderiales bacterium]